MAQGTLGCPGGGGHFLCFFTGSGVHTVLESDIRPAQALPSLSARAPDALALLEQRSSFGQYLPCFQLMSVRLGSGCMHGSIGPGHGQFQTMEK